MAVSDDIKLDIYNDALRILGERRLATLSEDRKPRHVLDDIWGASNKTVDRALEAADWNFASRTVKGSYSASIEPDFGWRRAFEKPTDCIRMTTISGDEFLRVPMTHQEYSDQNGYWLCDLDEIYVRFVSNLDDYGMNGGIWPQSFRDLVAAQMAEWANRDLTNSSELQGFAMAAQERALSHAKSRDSQDEGTKFPPAGSWVSSRGRQRRERGRVSFL